MVKNASNLAYFYVLHIDGIIFGKQIGHYILSRFKINRAKKIWGTRQKSSPKSKQKKNGTSNFFGLSYFETALEPKFWSAASSFYSDKPLY